MKKFVWILSIFISTNLCAQDWRIVSQNNQNSGNFTPANVWMSPSGNRLGLSVFTQETIGLQGTSFVPTKKQQVIFLEGDTLNTKNTLFHFQQNFISGPLLNDILYFNDSLIYAQVLLDSFDNVHNYTPHRIEEFKGFINLSSNSLLSFKSDQSNPSYYFPIKEVINLNSRFLFNQPFGGDNLIGSSNHMFMYLLTYDKYLTELQHISTSFHKPDSSTAGYLIGSMHYMGGIVYYGSTIKNGGRVFDEFIDDADILAITDTLGNKKKVFYARKATFKYINYDGNNIYYTCECFPNISFVQNTPMPGFSLAKLDSAGRVKWVHRIPPDASVVQDTAFRTYIFGHQRNAEPLFGETMGNNELYMAVVDTDGTVLHFEHDSNFFWPNSYFYKLLYSPVTGVNLFMSHIEPVSLGNLQVVNDSASQNMFLARFALLEAQDTSGNSSLNEAKSDGRLFVYPNPGKEHVNIRYHTSMEAIQIIDMNGKQVLHQTFSPATEKHHDISFLSPGNYIVQVKSNNRWIKSSFVKE